MVNALSSRFIVRVGRDGGYQVQEYIRGQPLSFQLVPSESPPITSTSITFWPDTAVFGDAEFCLDLILEDMRLVCYLNSQLTVQVMDARREPEAMYKFHSADGLVSYVRQLNADKKIVHQPIHVDATLGKTEVHVALQYNYSDGEQVLGYANNFYTSDGGRHVTGFLNALTDTLNHLGFQSGLFSTFSLDNGDVCRGLCAVVSVWLQEPEFIRSSKTELNNYEIGEQVYAVTVEMLRDYFTGHPTDLLQIVNKLLRSRVALDVLKTRI